MDIDIFKQYCSAHLSHREDVNIFFYTESIEHTRDQWKGTEICRQEARLHKKEGVFAYYPEYGLLPWMNCTLQNCGRVGPCGDLP